jgi:hypothetical protein
MKLKLTPDQCAELEIIFKAVDAGQIVIGQIRRSPQPEPDAGQFVLFYTLASQDTGARIRKIIEKEHQKHAAKVTPQ